MAKPASGGAKGKPNGKDSGWSNARSAAGNHNPWLITVIISIATFMEVLDSAIANVSLPHIAGSLAVSTDESTWVVTSYLVANAIVIPISGWLADVIGRKRYYMISVALFTISSLLCGLAPNLSLLIVARLFQGVGGGGLAPSVQSMLADSFPPSKRGQAFGAYGIVVVAGPTLGPTLGGYITDNFSWHWIFLINVPVGIISLVLSQLFVCEPKILTKERCERLKRGLRLDYIGFAFVALGLGFLEITLDRGNREDWFGSGLIVTTAIIAGCSLAFLIVWEIFYKDPIVNLRLLANRNFAISCGVMLIVGVIIFGTTQLIPQMLQEVQGYTATDAGLALSVGGIATVIGMPIVGRLTDKVDARLLLFPALIVEGLAMWNLSHFSPDISFGKAAIGRLYQAVAVPFLFVPITAVAYVGIDPAHTNQVSALLNVARNLGGTIGISTAQTVLATQQQVHQSQIVEGLNPLNPSYVQGLSQITQQLGGQAMDALSASGVLYQQVQNQANMMSYIDVYHGLMYLVFGAAPLVLILRGAKGRTEGVH